LLDRGLDARRALLRLGGVTVREQPARASGSVRRTHRMTTASAGPARKPSRQPSAGPIQFQNASDTSVPMIEPAQ
jgi:hypothetical protein